MEDLVWALGLAIARSGFMRGGDRRSRVDTPVWVELILDQLIFPSLPAWALSWIFVTLVGVVIGERDQVSADNDG